MAWTVDEYVSYVRQGLNIGVAQYSALESAEESTLESNDIAGAANAAVGDDEREEAYALQGEKQATESRRNRGGATPTGVTCLASMVYLEHVRSRSGTWARVLTHPPRRSRLQGRRVEVCTFRRADLPTPVPGSVDDRVIVVNAGTIAAARPLALQLARLADCPVIAYTHAGLCALPDQGPTRRPPLTHDARGSSHADSFAWFTTAVRFAARVAASVEVTEDTDPVFSAWALPPVPLLADPTSDAESDELAAVLRHIGASRGVLLDREFASAPSSPLRHLQSRRSPFHTHPATTTTPHPRPRFHAAVLVGSGYNWLATMKAALRNEARIAGLVLVDPYLPDHVSRVFAGDCIDMLAAPVVQKQPLVTSFIAGPPIAHAASSPSVAEKANSHTGLALEESRALCELLDSMSSLEPLYVAKLAPLVLGLPLRTVIPIGAARAAHATMACAEALSSDDEYDEADSARLGGWAETLLSVQSAIKSFGPAYVGLANFPVPLYPHDVILAQYLRAQAVGASLGPYGAVPPHAFIDQAVEGGDFGVKFQGAFSDRLVGWLPPAPTEGSRVLRRWALRHGIAEARGPWLDLEARLGSQAAMHWVVTQSAPSDEGDDAAPKPATKKTVTAHQAPGCGGPAAGAAFSSSVAQFCSDVAASSDQVLRLHMRTLENAALAGVAEDAASATETSTREDSTDPSSVQSLIKELKDDAVPSSKAAARTEYVLQQVEALAAENFVYERLQIVDPLNRAHKYLLPPADSTLAALAKRPPLLLNTLGAAGVRWEDLRDGKLADSWVKTYLQYVMLRATVAHSVGVDPLRYSSDLDARVADAARALAEKRIRDTASWGSTFWGAIVGGAPVSRQLLMPVVASRFDFERLAPDMAAKVSILKPAPPPEVSEDGMSVPRAPTAVLPVSTMADLLRGVSFRQRTLERFRADLEPHRWTLPLNILAPYATAVDAHASLTPLGKGFAIQPPIPIADGLLFEACRSPEASSPGKGDRPGLGMPVDGAPPPLQLLHNPVVTGRLSPGPDDVLDDPRTFDALGNSLSLGRFVRTGSRHLWCGLISWVRANFALDAEDVGDEPRGLKRHSPSFPVRVLVTVLPESRLQDPLVFTPSLEWNETVEVGSSGMRRTSRPAHFSMASHAPPSRAAVHSRLMLRLWQEQLLAAWRHALPGRGCVVSLAPESLADVAASQTVAAKALQRSLRVTRQLSNISITSSPVLEWECKVELVDPTTGSALALPAGFLPAASPHADDPLTLLSDVLASGAPQPYRPPVFSVAREVLSVYRSGNAGAEADAAE